MTVRVASLLRVSSKKQAKGKGKGKEDLDIPGQRQAIAEFVARQPGWVLLQECEYKEAGVSAYKLSASDRDILQAAMNDAKAGKYDILCVWKGDRLSRRIEDLPGIVKDLTRAGIRVWAVADAPGGKEWKAENAMDLLMLAIEGFKNEVYSEQISVNVKMTKRQLAQQGVWSGGRPPYGYMLQVKMGPDGQPERRRDRVAQELVPNPETAHVVRRIFEEYAQGKGAFAIAAGLNADGIPSPWGRAVWQAQGIRSILRNPIYTGRMVYGRSTMAPKDLEAPIEAMGSHEPLISEFLWRKVSSLRESKAALAPRQRASTYLFTGVLRCSECGGLMYGTKIAWKRGREIVRVQGYQCKKYHLSKACSPTFYRASDLDDCFVDLMESLHQPSQLRRLAERRAQETNQRIADAQAERQRLTESLTETKRALAVLDEMFYRKGRISEDEYFEKKAQYQADLRQIEDKLRQPLPAHKESFDLSGLLEMTKDIRTLWEHHMPPEERKAFVLNIVQVWGLRLEAVKDDKNRSALRIG